MNTLLKILQVLLLVYLLPSLLNAQSNSTISLIAKLDNQTIHLDSIYELDSTRKIQINTLKFYLGNIEFSNDEIHKHLEPIAYYLVDFSQLESTTLKLNKPDSLTYKQLKFSLGTDSLTNISGAMDGVLDPTKGMYWAWQSGYINFKCEGKIIQNGTIKDFTYHLGGYQAPLETVQIIELSIKEQEKINLPFDLQPFFKELIQTETFTIMSPGSKAQEGMKILSQSF
jgi:hypothetical protein